MTPTPPPPRSGGYARALAGEAAFWGEVASGEAAVTPPDWDVRRRWLVNRAGRARHVDALLASVGPGTRVLELGCGPGVLSIALARRGAHVVALDVSPGALTVADRYYASVAPSISGTVRYQLADLNQAGLPPGPFDLVVAMGVLHHLVDPRRLVGAVADALPGGGRFWVMDTVGRDSQAAALVAGLVLLVVPSEMPFTDKWRGVFRFGAASPARVRASMEADGLSPMEGAGRDLDWVTVIEERFAIWSRDAHPAVSGYLASQIRMPRRAAGLFVALVTGVDRGLVRAGLWRGAGITIEGRKRSTAGSR